MSAFLSGEMKDTVELNPAGAYGTCPSLFTCIYASQKWTLVLEKFFSRKERQRLFRSWAGSASMWIKVGKRKYCSPLLRR